MSVVTLVSLAESRRWVGWCLARRDGTGAPTKTPFTAPGRMARSNDSGTWLTRADAERVASRLDKQNGMGGVGLMLGSHGGVGIGGVDLDTCRAPETGAIEPWAQAVIDRFGSYAEVSPSGTGVKVFFAYAPGEAEAIREVLGGTGRTWKRPGGDHPPAIEIYISGRYFATTFDRLPDSPAELMPLRLDDLRWIVETAGPALKGQTTAAASSGNTLMPPASGSPPADGSRSARAYRVAMRLARSIAAKGGTVDDLDFELETSDDAELVDWLYEKGRAAGGRELQRAWDRAVAHVRVLSANDDFAAVAGPPAVSGQPARGLRLLSLAECDSAPDRGYVVKGMLAPGDLAALIGAPAAGKSIAAPNVAYRIARGLPVFGCRTKAGPVLYVAAEDSVGMRGRLAALRRVHGDAPNLHLVEGLSDLLSPESPDRAELARIVAEVRPVMIVIDTLSMAFPGLEENSAEAMGRVVAVGRGLARGGAAVLLVHHTTKAGDSTPRGHSLLNGALDAVIELDRAGEDGVIRGFMRKNRNGPCDLSIAFRIGTVEHGVDADGDPISRPYCIEVLWPAAVAAKRADRLTSNAKAHLKVLRQMEPRPFEGSGLVGVDVRDWREACRRAGVCPSAEQRVRNTAFRRAYEALAEAGLIETHDGFVCALPAKSEELGVVNGPAGRASKASKASNDAFDAHGGVVAEGASRASKASHPFRGDAFDAPMPAATAGGDAGVKINPPLPGLNFKSAPAGFNFKSLPADTIAAIRRQHGGPLADHLSGLLLDDALIEISGRGATAMAAVSGAHRWRGAGGELRP